MAYNNFMDFEYGGILLSSFGGILYNGNNPYVTKNLTPSLNLGTTTFSKHDGEVITSAIYGSRVIPLFIYINNKNFNETQFKAWLCSKTAKRFSYVGDDKYIMGIFTGEIDIQIYNKSESIVYLELVAHDPYWYKVGADTYTKTQPAINIANTFINEGSTTSTPLIHVFVSGTATNVQFSINDYTITLSQVYGDIYIDCEYRTVYTTAGQIKTNRLDVYSCSGLSARHKFDFPILQVGDNTFKALSSNIQQIDILKNTRFI